jgi:hypothetical protein
VSRGVTFVVLTLAACGAGPNAVQEAQEDAPSAALSPCLVSPPTRRVVSPLAVPLDERHQRARDLAEEVIRQHAVTLDNPWALGHALLALGPDLALPDGRTAVEGLFEQYATWVPSSPSPSVRFPAKVGSIRVEPHADLLLKAFSEAGVDPGQSVVVEGRPTTVASLYCGSRHRSWVNGERLSFDSWNDTPWALQGLAAWAPEGMSWTAEGGHAMTLKGLSSSVVGRYHKETTFLRDARQRGGSFQKRKQGIFAYTCGGAHLLQGAAYAVARGHGTVEDRERLSEAQHNLMARYPVEMAAVEAAMKAYPQYELKLRIQRLKFLGHYLESMHKLAAFGLLEVSPAARSSVALAREQTVSTLEEIEQLGWFRGLDAIRAADEQAYLDVLGDTAHALRGLDLSSGEGKVLL